MGPDDSAKQPSQGFSSLENVTSAFKGNGGSYNLAFVLIWIAVAAAVLCTIAIWLLDTSAVQAEKQKQTQKDTLIQTISSSEYADLDQKVSGIKSAYDEIKKDLTTNFYLSDFLPLLYKRVDTDVQINNVSVTEAGKLNIDGTAGSYRAVADQMVSLQNFAALKNVVLLSISMNVDSAGKTAVPFVFSADIDKTVSLNTISDDTVNANDNSNSSTSDDSTTGGANATNQ